MFDPLLVAHARRLEEIADGGSGALIVGIAEGAEPVLPARARAELVAALGAVHCVVILQGPSELLPGALEVEAVYREEAADEGRRRELMEQVWSQRE